MQVSYDLQYRLKTFIMKLLLPAYDAKGSPAGSQARRVCTER